MPAEPVLTVENLSVRLGGRPVLQGIHWQIQSGTQWAVLGPNGSGKTTLAKTLAGILPSSAGKIIFHPSKGNNGAGGLTRGDIGFVSVDSHRRVFEREAFAEEVRHFSGDDRRPPTASEFIFDPPVNEQTPPFARLSELQALCQGLGMQEAFLEKKLGALTTGEISRTLLLKALFKKPRLLLLDEPFNGLDRESQKTLADSLGRLIRTGVQVVLITHRMDEILPEISHVMLLTADGIRSAGRKRAVLQSAGIQKVHRISPGPLLKKAGERARPAIPGSRPFSARAPRNSMPAAAALVEMVDVTVRYGGRPVLAHVHWTIRQGENWMVHGPDGAGKTSLLKLITGENLQAYANDIYLFGKKKGSGESVWEIKKKIGWISSDLQFKYPVHIRGVEVVVSGFFDSMGLYRMASAAQRRQAERLLDTLDIGPLADARFGHLSHGQKQMLLIARALIKSPRLLLLDEPCEGLDFANRRKILDIIEFIGRHTPTAVVLATWDDAELPSGITHRLFLKDGTATFTPLPPGQASPRCCIKNRAKKV